MKKLILSLAVIAATLSASAQKKETGSPIKFSVGAEVAAPFGDFGEFYSFGIGGTVQGDYNVDEKLAITLNAGYVNFIGKDISGFKIPSIGIIPVLAGVKYHFTPQLYGSAQLGTGIFTADGESTSTFAYAPGIGYKFSENFDAVLKYQAYSKDGVTNSTGGIRIAYTF